MKKVLIIILAAALLLSACGGAANAEVSKNEGKAEGTAPETVSSENSMIAEAQAQASGRETVPAASDDGNMQPTGYAQVELQIYMLFYNGQLWLPVNDSDTDPNGCFPVTSLSDAYTFVGKVLTEDGRNAPETEFASAHIEVGTDVYISAKDDPRGEHLYIHTGGWERYYPLRPFREEDKHWFE